MADHEKVSLAKNITLSWLEIEEVVLTLATAVENVKPNEFGLDELFIVVCPSVFLHKSKDFVFYPLY